MVGVMLHNCQQDLYRSHLYQAKVRTHIKNWCCVVVSVLTGEIPDYSVKSQVCLECRAHKITDKNSD